MRASSNRWRWPIIESDGNNVGDERKHAKLFNGGNAASIPIRHSSATIGFGVDLHFPRSTPVARLINYGLISE